MISNIKRVYCCMAKMNYPCITIPLCTLSLYKKHTHTVHICEYTVVRYTTRQTRITISSIPWNEMCQKNNNNSTADERRKKIHRHTHTRCGYIFKKVTGYTVVSKLWASIHTLDWKNVANVAICYLFLSHWLGRSFPFWFRVLLARQTFTLTH